MQARPGSVPPWGSSLLRSGLFIQRTFVLFSSAVPGHAPLLRVVEWSEAGQSQQDGSARRGPRPPAGPCEHLPCTAAQLCLR